MGGRWDFLAARPHATLVSVNGVSVFTRGDRVEYRQGDSLALLREILGAAEPAGDFPFAGGAIGYFSYDIARELGYLPDSKGAHRNVPDMAVGLYDWVVVVDHRQRETYLVSQERDPETAGRWPELVALFSRESPVSQDEAWHVLVPPASNFDWPDYRAACRRVQHYIAEGDCYQINLTQYYSARVSGSRWGLYRSLRKLNPAPFGAYLNYPGLQVLSTSPERFIELRGGRVTTCPIKGTRPRGADPAQDRKLAEALQASEKDRAENLMIVDLLRNDLGRVCVPGSVAVPELFKVESFANVHHLVSTVTGSLAPGRDAIDLLRASIPGGSITGAPKRRAMAIIDELEPHRRGLYCGAIGYIGFNGDMDTNIVIRTLIGQGEQVGFGVGGGIVADSVVEQEFQECLDKAAPMLRLLSLNGRS